jgi:hypothetical protein
MDDKQIPETTSDILKEVLEKFALDKVYMVMFITEKGLMGEFTKYMQIKNSEFVKNNG